MARIATKMQLHKGFEEEYKKRHDQIWPELASLLKRTGIKDYSIFLDEETNVLFAVLDIDDASALDALKSEQIMQKWWQYMRDIMDTNEDNSPVSISLREMFFLQ